MDNTAHTTNAFAALPRTWRASSFIQNNQWLLAPLLFQHSPHFSSTLPKLEELPYSLLTAFQLGFTAIGFSLCFSISYRIISTQPANGYQAANDYWIIQPKQLMAIGPLAFPALSPNLKSYRVHYWLLFNRGLQILLFSFCFSLSNWIISEQPANGYQEAKDYWILQLKQLTAISPPCFSRTSPQTRRASSFTIDFFSTGVYSYCFLSLCFWLSSGIISTLPANGYQAANDYWIIQPTQLLLFQRSPKLEELLTAIGFSLCFSISYRSYQAAND